jgi:hypothetical protein
MMLLVALLVCFVNVAVGDIYTIMKEGDVKCFFEDVPQVKKKKKKKKRASPRLFFVEHLGCCIVLLYRSTRLWRRANTGFWIVS